MCPGWVRAATTDGWQEHHLQVRHVPTVSLGLCCGRDRAGHVRGACRANSRFFVSHQRTSEYAGCMNMSLKPQGSLNTVT